MSSDKQAKKEYPVLISYDVSGKWDEVKEALLKEGYVDSVIGVKKLTVKLPATTLYKKKSTEETAFDEVRAVIEEINLNSKPNEKIELERLIVSKAETWKGLAQKK